MRVKVRRSRPTILMIGAHQLVCDNVRILLRTMGCHCVAASSLTEALVLSEKERPDAAVLDSRLPVPSPPEIVAALHKIVLRLERCVVVLTVQDGKSQLPLLDAYSLPKVPVDLLFQELWPCLDSLLHGNVAPAPPVYQGRLVFDSLVQPLPSGVRAALAGGHTLLYECGDVVVDLWLEAQIDARRIKLVGQVLHEERSEPLPNCVPVVLQSKAEPIEATTTNELGEFQLDFAPHDHLRLEIGVAENHWVSVELPTSRDAVWKN
ncbi:MAG: hypothetical protein DMG39_27325 [Acidobacteria bacterium]|nr:MAG: hypothetical protein DMG39_27325 [Acidobacteriota bacterium]